MFGLEFSPAAAVNVAAAGAVGATVTLAVAWWSTRETRERLELLLEFLEGVTLYEHGKESGVPAIVQDPDTGKRTVGRWVVSRRSVPYEHVESEGDDGVEGESDG